MFLLIENIIRGGKSNIMGDRYVESVENKKILYAYVKNFYGHPMSQSLLYDGIKFEKDVCLYKILNTADDNDIGYFLEVDLS